METKKKQKSNKTSWRLHLNCTQIITLSFLCVILIGAGLLSLPIASRTHAWTPFTDALFTSFAATCVTGLTIYDTYSHWNGFGQIVLLVLIQIGGLGFMTVMSFLSMITKRRISLHQRRLIMQAAGHIQLNGVLTLVRKIFIGTFIFEGIGAVLLASRFCRTMGMKEGIYYGIFHSVSAFCNAGIDLMGKYQPFSSFTLFQSDALVQTVLMCLTVIGGVGFFVWSDIMRCGIHVKKYALHTKMVLSMTAFLLLGGWLGFFFLEYNGALAGMPLGEKILSSLFQSVMTRSAGFVVFDQSLMRGGSVLTVVLMLIGGSPGSTAGGIKTTTVFVAMLTTVSTIRNKRSSTIFKKKISDETVRQACSIITIYISLIFVSTIAVMLLEDAWLTSAVFEVSAALGTAGISLGLTPSLCIASKYILMLLMFVGRIGGYSFIIGFAMDRPIPDMERPVEKILVG